MSTVQEDATRQETQSAAGQVSGLASINAAQASSTVDPTMQNAPTTGGLASNSAPIAAAPAVSTADPTTPDTQTTANQVSDPELIEAARLGDSAAFAELYRRHARAAVVVASHCARSRADIEDIVAEAFARILRLIKDGAGPTDFFRAYLFTTVRRLAERHRPVATDHDPSDEAIAHLVERSLSVSGTDATLPERDVMRTAFESLPERWREVLWYVEVEDRTPAEIAPHFQLSPNGVAALSHRAREGLCQAYLQQHLSNSTDAACQPVRAELGAYARGSLSERARQRVGVHLAGCGPCTEVLDEAKDINRSLRRALLPLVFGSAAPALIKALKSAAPLPPPVAPVPAAPALVKSSPAKLSSVTPNQSSQAPANSYSNPPQTKAQSAAPRVTSMLRPRCRFRSLLRHPAAATRQVIVGISLAKMIALAAGALTATSGFVYAAASIHHSAGPSTPVTPAQSHSVLSQSVHSSQPPSPQFAPDGGGLVPVYSGHGLVSATEIGGPIEACVSPNSSGTGTIPALDTDSGGGTALAPGTTQTSAPPASCLASAQPVNLDLPTDATVDYASLIWMATDPGPDWAQATLVGPDGQSHLVHASTTWPLPDGAAQAAADVTKLVAATGGGAWHLDAVSRALGHDDQAAAWSLIVAYTSPSLGKESAVVVYQGSAPLPAGGSFNLSTPLDQAHADHIGVVNWGGPLDAVGTSFWLVNSNSSTGVAQPLQTSTPPNLATTTGCGLGLTQASDIWFPHDPDGTSATGLSFRSTAAAQPAQPPNAANPISPAAPACSLAIAAVATVG